ncbi:MAG TPA: TRASH domain-containing protein [Candidatus Altiarchaeales archaeon]|nr:TRASH domain-containing protein [Candidatus Altiarchaeales archaeon]
MNCSFCGKEIEPGTGSMFVTRKGKMFYFCASKCKKNLLKLKRKPRTIRWTNEYMKEKEIRIKAMSREKKKVKKRIEKKSKTKVSKKKGGAKELKKTKGKRLEKLGGKTLKKEKTKTKKKKTG